MVKVNDAFCPKNHNCPALNYCPTGAIVQNSPFEAPRIIEEKCIKCGKCTKACYVFSCDDCKGK